jgi:Arc/MetJ family transcription regulator
VPTNLALDDRLIEKVRRAGGHKTKKAAVTAALEEYLRHRQRLLVLGLRDSIDYDPRYDYKAERRSRR